MRQISLLVCLVLIDCINLEAALGTFWCVYTTCLTSKDCLSILLCAFRMLSFATVKPCHAMLSSMCMYFCFPFTFLLMAAFPARG